MNRTFGLVPVVLLALFPALALADDVPPGLAKWLKPLSVKSSTLGGGVLRVEMKRGMVSEDVYRGVVDGAVCLSLADSPAAWGKARVERVEVLNDIGAQGFALLDARATCAAYGKANMEGGKKIIAEHTVGCVAGVCRTR